mmetsp:Transcript_13073/g.18168  ORF Transcript_13073/g.18168 Transcript_13073/m.18168 type:complete len:286 (+) Transcript_13073:251-1108(+)
MHIAFPFLLRIHRGSPDDLPRHSSPPLGVSRHRRNQVTGSIIRITMGDAIKTVVVDHAAQCSITEFEELGHRRLRYSSCLAFVTFGEKRPLHSVLFSGGGGDPDDSVAIIAFQGCCAHVKQDVVPASAHPAGTDPSDAANARPCHDVITRKIRKRANETRNRASWSSAPLGCIGTQVTAPLQDLAFPLAFWVVVRRRGGGAEEGYTNALGLPKARRDPVSDQGVELTSLLALFAARADLPAQGIEVIRDQFSIDHVHAPPLLHALLGSLAVLFDVHDSIPHQRNA